MRRHLPAERINLHQLPFHPQSFQMFKTHQPQTVMHYFLLFFLLSGHDNPYHPIFIVMTKPEPNAFDQPAFQDTGAPGKIAKPLLTRPQDGDLSQITEQQNCSAYACDPQHGALL